MAISFRSLADAVERMARPLYGHWVAPFWESIGRTADEVAATGGLIGPEEEFVAHIDSLTNVNFVSLNDNPVRVVINLFDQNGAFLPDLSTVLEDCPPRSWSQYTVPAIGVRAHGYLLLSCLKPIYPSGTITKYVEDDSLSRPKGGPTPLVQKEKAREKMDFYPIFERTLEIEPKFLE